MESFFTAAWFAELARALNEHREWRDASLLYFGKIALNGETNCGRLEVLKGEVVATMASNTPINADIVISGPDDEWQRVLMGHTNWFQATSDEAGSLVLSGDIMLALQNIKTMWLLFEIMSELHSKSTDLMELWSPAPSPKEVSVCGRYISIENMRIYYEVAGKGQPIICFHAACQDSLMYRHVLTELSEHYRVIAVDAPAHGKSSEPEGGPFQSLTQHAQFNEKLIAALGLKKPVILGCSMAGNLVLEMAARAPNAYSAVISAEGADFTPTISDAVLDMLLVVGPQLLEGYGKALTGSRTPPDRAREVLWQLRRATPEVMRGDLKGYAGFDIRNKVSDIQAPVLLIRGENDWLVSQSQVNETATRIKNVCKVLLSGTGHYPMIENPVEFNSAVQEFLSDKLFQNR